MEPKGAKGVEYIVDMKKNAESNGRGGKEGEYVTIYKGPEASLTKKDFQQATDYTFRIRTLCGNDESEWKSAQARTQKISIPNNLKARTLSSDTISLSWEPVESKGGKAVKYCLEMRWEKKKRGAVVDLLRFTMEQRQSM